MGLTMGQRQAVTKTIATRYRRASKSDVGKILEVVALRVQRREPPVLAPGEEDPQVPTVLARRAAVAP